LAEPHTAATASTDPIQHFLAARFLGQAPQLVGEVLLQGLALRRSTPPQRGMDVVGHGGEGARLATD